LLFCPALNSSLDYVMCLCCRVAWFAKTATTGAGSCSCPTVCPTHVES